ncbi:hypothetical protein LPMP_322440 [Leishmania panamensis]|uniref:Uncharacterized protein n=1 Tax=Leishmania panamensis TaxID=5679 RepID=A0A088S0S6_LEIPA|nr:hypothetical protein LPMP_322440 [Leishmania panamensis]AIO01130.1 hypothetical protein LPMP_322440 [Leishmania panamensis]
MSWVRVKCSDGHSYAAPSHGRSIPKLDGMARLFQAPFSLRQLHTFTTLSNNAPTVSGWGSSDLCGILGTDESVNSCIMVDQRDLGDHLGLTTVAVGDEGDTELVESPSLRLLLDRVFAVLISTNGGGVQVLLDALCTRAPPPLTAVARVEAAIVHEDDGGRRVRPELWLARTRGVGSTLQDTSCSVSASSNQQFLVRLSQDCSAVGDAARDAERLSLQPPPSNMAAVTLSNHAARAPPQVVSTLTNALPGHPSSAFSELPKSPSLVTRSPLSYAAALRRRSLLFFLPQGVVPLSVLGIHLELSTRVVKCQRRAAKPAPFTGGANPQTTLGTCTGGASIATDGAARSLYAVLLEGLRHVRIGPVRTGGAPKSDCASCTSTRCCCCAALLHCVSHLRRQSGRLLAKSSSWAAVARTAEESGRVLVWAIARLLAGSERLMSAHQATDLTRLILYDLWADKDSHGAEGTATEADGAAPSMLQTGMTPLVAVYSPSGLLFASARFSMLLSHEEQVLLSAAAIDRLARYAAPRSSVRSHASTPAADALSWTSWPMRVGEAAGMLAGAVVMDVLLITVGDALAFCLAFPRAPFSASVPPTASILSVLSLLESTVAKARSQAKAPSAMTTASLAPALVFACTHSTAPYTPTFHDSLFAVTALEDALDTSKTTSAGESADSAAGGLVGVAQHLHQLVLREASQSRLSSGPGAGATVDNAPSFVTGAASTPHQASMGTAVEESTSRNRTDKAVRGPSGVSSALHKIFSCLPLPPNDSNRGVASSRQRYITAAQQQSAAYLNQSRKGGHLSSLVPVANTSMLQSSNPYTAFLLAMPLEEMLCYVSALVTRNELGTLRSSYELGLHSFFFLQRPAVAAAAKHRCAGSAKVSGSRPHKRKNAVAQQLALPARFGISFSRFRLQQSPCTHAVIPEEWADAHGAPDRSGGRLTFFEDPSLLLQLNAHGVSLAGRTLDEDSGNYEGCEASPEDADQRPNETSSRDASLETQVSVVPVWTLLQAAPDESLGDGELSGSDTETSDSDSAAAADGFHGVHRSVPPSVDEDAQLVTSLHYAYPQRLHCRRAAPLLVTAKLSTISPVIQDASSSTTPHLQSSAYPPQVHATYARSAKSKQERATEVLCHVEAIVSICGDITGIHQSIVMKALQRHALSSSAEAQLTSGNPQHGSGEGSASSAAVTPDSLPAEWEYAADAPHKMADLCREVVWCQEAALALLEGASCLT